MISAKGLVFDSVSTFEMLLTREEDSPLVVQLFGNDPSYLSRAISILKDKGFWLFDLNAGCPVKKVTRTGAGAALLRDTHVLLRILESMVREAGEGRVGVKMRLGWDSSSLTCLEVARELESLGVGWVTLHPRFAREGFAGKARWEYIKEMKSLTTVPVIASGDLFSAEDGIRCVKETGADSVMFARGALRNPAIFREYILLMRGHCFFRERQELLRERVSMIRSHLELLKETYGRDRCTIYRLRSILARYIRGFPSSRLLRERAVQIVTWEDVESLLKEMEALIWVRRS